MFLPWTMADLNRRLQSARSRHICTRKVNKIKLTSAIHGVNFGALHKCLQALAFCVLSWLINAFFCWSVLVQCVLSCAFVLLLPLFFSYTYIIQTLIMHCVREYSVKKKKTGEQKTRRQSLTATLRGSRNTPAAALRSCFSGYLVLRRRHRLQI